MNNTAGESRSSVEEKEAAHYLERVETQEHVGSHEHVVSKEHDEGLERGLRIDGDGQGMSSCGDCLFSLLHPTRTDTLIVPLLNRSLPRAIHVLQKNDEPDRYGLPLDWITDSCLFVRRGKHEKNFPKVRS